MLQQALQEKVAQPEDPTDEVLLQYAQMYATYYNGAKKSSHILFNSDDEATAQEVLDKINSESSTSLRPQRVFRMKAARKTAAMLRG